MFLLNINHVAIIASNLERSLDFYTKILGLKKIHSIHRPERQSTIIYLDAQNCIVELFSFPNPPERLSYPEATGLRHLAFSTNKFDEMLVFLDSHEIFYETPRIDQRTDKRMTFIFDPDKLPIEISEI